MCVCMCVVCVNCYTVDFTDSFNLHLSTHSDQDLMAQVHTYICTLIMKTSNKELLYYLVVIQPLSP
jgi:hypothetical protein